MIVDGRKSEGSCGDQAAQFGRREPKIIRGFERKV